MLEKKKLGKMIEDVLKGELILSEYPTAHKDMFKTLCVAYENTIEQPIIQAPTLRPPPMRITTTTITTIENPTPNLRVIIKDVNMGECVKEITNNKLFLKYQERAEMENLKPFEGLYIDGEMELIK